MVVEYNDEYCKIILRKDINTEPYEVIDIVDLLEAWEQHKADTPQTDFVEDDKCFDCEDFFDCDEHQTDCPRK